ncbi:DUF1566 domain-containing protein [Candidatus Sulfurimonas baltica]|uniref:DUF1566 domain-containing protein n=1 Tax=Candidatus Sulfurimonas baltica TaxID=2740404 RepID=A0A7S7RMJ7_9BACT|nr:DUF1566 domain-containing protein [Candidatus Sulfurimonas baltica]QOY52302.1 DUF1566 domain-containing protein [Candidatus Sulfurimonas baltica]
MFLKLFLFLLPFSLFAGEVVWSSDASSEISQSEYDKVIEEYVDNKYPERVEAWEKKQKEIQNNTISLDGLMWQDNKDAIFIERDWIGAKEYCKDLILGGFNDWRLPNIDELKSILDKNRKPTIKKEFKNTVSGSYWSSTTTASNTTGAWRVYFSYGGQSSFSKTYYYYVRCVRAGQ